MGMKPLAWVLVVLIPWTAFVTVFLALRRGRPRPYADWGTARIQQRLDELDRLGSSDDARERRQLWAELFARGRGHEHEADAGGERPPGSPQPG